MAISLLLVSCLVLATVPFFMRGLRFIFGAAFLASSGVFVLSLYTAIPLFFGASSFENGYWYLDTFAALMVLLIGFIQWTATITSIHYLGEEVRTGEITLPAVRRYFFFVGLFVCSMLLTIVSNNLGFMWIALEATTLTTTLLVAFYAHKGSLEAAWKYLILCSTGISLGLIGLFLTYYAASSSGLLHGLSAISWTNLLTVAPSLPPHLMQIAFVFILIGYGTKVGLVPMHAWLPDAHSRAPSPISGMLSGILLNAALFGILRFRVLVDGSLASSEWTSELFLVFGVLSCIIPAAFILIQADYKRLLAYSSIEHMGLIVFSAGLGTVGAVASVIHIVGHALLKSALFFSAGNILLRFKSTKFDRIGQVMRTLPYTGALFLTLILMLLAIPPSPLFGSELLLISQSVVLHPIFATIVLLALAIIFAGFIRLIIPFLFSPALVPPKSEVEVGEKWGWSHTAIAFHLILLVAFSVFLMTPMASPILERIITAIS
ncbi:MAG: hydrogenase-4 component F [Parcubacteria group bacterium Greene0714_7]|nr:MAG: hydrogenase-4 component F [Parcubacteria group bacterium Greene0714_7]